METSADTGGHVKALDGVRALAILLVLGVHAAGPLFGQATRGNQAVTFALNFGWIGVDVFFVLSGMLITGILLDTKGAQGYYASFYARRALRIFPIYYAALFVLLVAAPVVAGWVRHHAPEFPARQGWLWTYTTNVSMAVDNSWDVLPRPTWPFWSLAVEEQFYMVWPFVVARLSRPALARTAAAMVVVALVLRTGLAALGGHPLTIYASTLTRMDALALGALVAIAAREPGGLARFRPYVAPVLAACAAAFAALCVVGNSGAWSAPPIATVGHTLLALGGAAFLVGVLTAAPRSFARRALETRPARHIGARSYGFYVWHMAVVLFAARIGSDWLAPVVPWYVLRGLIMVLLCVAVTLAVAELGWVLIEAPFLRLKRLVPRPTADRSPRRDDAPAAGRLEPAIGQA